jgi:hypothetical protein
VTETVCGPYSAEDWAVMLLLKRQINRMSKKSDIYYDLLKRDTLTFKNKYLRKVS